MTETVIIDATGVTRALITMFRGGGSGTRTLIDGI